jgi:Mg2+ and Co2+ transporter CorA
MTMSIQNKTPESKSNGSGINHGDIHIKQEAGELARKIGAANGSEVSSAASNEHKCRGWNIKRERISEEEKASGNYKPRTRYLYWAAKPGGSNPKANEYARELSKKTIKLAEAATRIEELESEAETLREHLETNERVIQEHSKRSTIEITKEFKDLLEAAEAQVRDRDEDSSRILADALMTFYKKSKVDF